MQSEHQKEWRKNNPDKVKLQRQRYYQKNKARILREQKKRLPKLKEDRKQNPLKYRNYELKKDYGITLDDYNHMLQEQGGVCKICGTDDPGRPSFCVDHDHATDKIRGLLCNNCNRALGLLKDDVRVLLKAVEYLNEQAV